MTFTPAVDQQYAKVVASSSDGTCLLQLHGSKELIAFNVHRCSKIVGVEEHLSSWLSNTLRVFAPVKYSIYSKNVEVKFPLEGVSFVAERIMTLDSTFFKSFMEEEGFSLVGRAD